LINEFASKYNTFCHFWQALFHIRQPKTEKLSQLPSAPVSSIGFPAYFSHSVCAKASLVKVLITGEFSMAGKTKGSQAIREPFVE
jgi:hypothetical protein